MLKVFGSPGKRQIDGLGGADPLTSKMAIIGAPRFAGTDVTDTFGEVEIDQPHVDYRSLCGNISAAAGQFAIENGMVPILEPVTVVRAWTTDLNATLTIEVPVKDGKPVRLGSYRVPGTGARRCGRPVGMTHLAPGRGDRDRVGRCPWRRRPQSRRATLGRTARRIVDGTVYLDDRV